MTDLEQIRAGLYAKIEKTKLALDEVDNVLNPILKILERHDIPVDYIRWDDDYHSITIKHETKLTKAVFDKIEEFLGFEADQHVMDSHISFFFNLPYNFKHPHIHIEYWWLVISNGNDTCKVREIREEHIVRKTETTTRWEPVGDCTPFRKE